MRSTLERQAHLILIIALVCVATLPSWFVSAESNGATFDSNLKAGRTTDDNTAQREAEARNGHFNPTETQILETGDKYEFQTEVSRLMSLIINSLYSNRDIFLRELISNASDALDKLRFVALTDSSVDNSIPLEIRIKPDLENKKLHFIDTGVGMTKEELVANLGTIAKSGTSEFISKMSSSPGDTSSLIGQFGVGFYSAFLVADRVTVVSRGISGDQHVWTSDSNGSFVVGPDPEGNTLPRGTVITLHLKDSALSYLNQETLRGLVSKYSEFITFPIYLQTSRVEEREVIIEGEFDEASEDEDNEKEEDEMDWDKVDIIEETIWEWELLNDVKPLWTRDPSEISDEEYVNFYKSLSKSTDEEDPYIWTHFTAEGDLEFRAILYIPSELPDSMFDASREHNNRGVKLYVRRVFISDEFDRVIPKYLSFIKGVVDSDSLPLNVSREILQHDRSLKQMEKKIVRKAIAMIQKLAQDDESTYKEFYNDYRLNLKLGVLEDKPNQERLAKLLRFHSSKSGSELVSLDKYIENKKEGQTKIFYLGGESKEAISNSPLLEILIKRDYEVLYFTDSIDEYWTQAYPSYEGLQFVNIAKDVNLDIGEDETPEEEEIKTEDFDGLLTYLKSALGPKISKVILSKRLTTTPTALISSAYSFSANMERIQKAQALGQGVDPFMASKKVLEVNPKHHLIQRLNDLITEDAESQTAKDLTEILFDTAALHSGFSLDNPAQFAKSIHRMLELGLGN